MNFSKKESQKIDNKFRYRQRARHWAGKVPVCVIYPNTYFLAMSNLGFQTIYHFFSSDGRFSVDRLFYPGSTKLALLLSHETGHKLKEFYILAFSISYENDMLNALKMLRAGGIPLKRSERGGKFPMVIAGGAAITLNPGALSQVFDAFFIGECEDSFSEFADSIVKNFERGSTKEHLLRTLSEIEGFYIPGFYNSEFNKEGRIIGISPLSGVPKKVKRRIASDINIFVPRTFIFTTETEFKNMGVIEISRGCRWRCRFCAASYIYYPPRFRSKDVIKKEIIEMSGFCSKFGLLGPLPTDHPELEDITNFLLHIQRKFSFSSVRIGSLSNNLIINLKQGGENTITLAPETGSEDLRRIINKPITNRALFSQIDRVVKNGIKRIKLYFLVGLPNEKDSDIYSIAELARELTKMFRVASFTFSIGIFVPKPHTPFQWCGLASYEIISRRMKILKSELRNTKNILLEIPSVKTAIIEALLVHGDELLSDKLIESVNSGNINRLLKIINCDEYIFRKKEDDEFFPWDIIDNGIDRSFLLSEYKSAISS